MAIEVTESGTMVTGEHIAVFQLLSLKGRLKIEIRTGMVMSRGVSTLKALQRMGITKARTKEAALRDLEAYIEALEV